MMTMNLWASLGSGGVQALTLVVSRVLHGSGDVLEKFTDLARELCKLVFLRARNVPTGGGMLGVSYGSECFFLWRRVSFITPLRGSS